MLAWKVDSFSDLCLGSIFVDRSSPSSFLADDHLESSAMMRERKGEWEEEDKEEDKGDMRL